MVSVETPGRSGAGKVPLLPTLTVRRQATSSDAGNLHSRGGAGVGGFHRISHSRAEPIPRSGARYLHWLSHTRADPFLRSGAGMLIWILRIGRWKEGPPSRAALIHRVQTTGDRPSS